MVDQNSEKINVPERKVSGDNKSTHFERESRRSPEVKESSAEDRIVSQELRREIEMMELDDTNKAEAVKQAQKIDYLGEKDKIEHLLKIARKKGLVFAIQVARRMNEPYLLDVLHDTLAEEGFYKDFIPGRKSSDDDGNKK